MRAGSRLYYRVLIALALMIFASASSAAEIEPPVTSDALAVRVSAKSAHRWQQGAYDVWLLSGGVEIKQGEVIATASDAVLWIDRAASGSAEPSKIIGYLEHDVTVDYGRASERGEPQRLARIQDQTWFGRFHTRGQIDFNVPQVEGAPANSAVYARGMDARRPEPLGELSRPSHVELIMPASGDAASAEREYPVQRADGGSQAAGQGSVERAQFLGPLDALGGREPIATPPGTPAAGASAAGLRRVRVFPRSTAPVQARWFSVPNRNERVAVVESGVTVIVDGLDQVGTIDLSTDRIVIWTTETAVADLSGKKLEEKNVPLEFYMEGNIIFRQGDRVIYANRMYYNVSQEYGVVLDAEVLTPVPEYQGLLRLKADVLQQLDRQNFQAYGAALTSSRLGVPRYWLQSQQVTFQDNQKTAINPYTGQLAVDPVTGEPAVEHDMQATSRNNFLFYGGYPVFYWPTIATDLRDPTYYIESIKIANDRVFGFQVYTDFNAYQLFGIRDRIEGTKWQLSTDFLSDRGPAAGTNFKYNRDSFFHIPGPTYGFVDAWGIYDTGLDNLGADRMAIKPDTESRGRILARHRQQLPGDWQFTGEFGLISDRNFLEQYFEKEWDQQKDQNTGIELKRYADTMSYSLTSDVRLNDFFTQTEWLPRLDHYWLGQDVFNVLTYTAHTNVGYAKLQTADGPEDPIDAAKFSPLAWESEREGMRLATRQSIDYPVTLGPVKVVPYLLGEAAHWGEDLAGNDINRVFGQVGVRASMPMWTVNRDVHSELLNLNGLAHKVVFDAEYFYADASQDLNEFPLYDPLDDDQVEHFRRRYYFNTFGGVPGGHVPQRFDERYYALRTGLQSSVTSPSTEVADDLSIARFGIRQRWQTKRGLPGRERIIDWITFDVQASLFPDAARDNFDEDIGLINYDLRWHIGDRLTILSDGYADLFEDGLRTATIGGVVSRPELGSLYLGYQAIDGPFRSSIVNAAVTYRMSEKWILTGASSFDMESAGNIGQTLSVTRIGESLLMRFGFAYDESRDNLSLQFAIEPRFLPSSKLGRVGGVQIPPAGTYGLE